MNKQVIFLLLALTLISAQNLPFQQITSCNLLNCPTNCPAQDEECSTQLANFQNCLQGKAQEDTPSCVQYQQIINSPDADPVPQSNDVFQLWDDCLNECKVYQQQSDNFFDKYIIQCQDGCLKQGEIPAPSNQVNIAQYDYCVQNSCHNTAQLCQTSKQCQLSIATSQFCQQNSAQCQQAQQTYKTANGNTPYPFALQSCIDSCRFDNYDPLTKQTFTCQNECRAGLTPVETLDFTYGEFTDCLDHYRAVCSRNDQTCRDTVQQIESARENIPQCTQCSKDLIQLTKLSTNKDIYSNLMPQSCSQCEQNLYADNENYPDVVRQYIIQPVLECALNGEVSRLQDSVKNSITGGQMCIEHNITGCASSDAECKIAQDNWNDCVSNYTNGQCKFAQKELDTNSENAQQAGTTRYPYAKLVCEQSCMNEFNDPTFGEILNQRMMCMTNIINIPHSIQQTLQCEEQYLPLPNTEQPAFQEYKSYQDCISDSSIPACSICDRQDIEDNKQDYTYNCIYCSNICLEKLSQASTIFLNYMAPTLKACTLTGTFQGYNNVEIQATKESYDYCIFHQCRQYMQPTSTDYQNDLKDFTQCVENSAQCSKAYGQFDNLQTGEQIPPEYVACRQACFPVNAHVDFINKMECEYECETTYYEPPASLPFTFAQVVQCQEQYCPTPGLNSTDYADLQNLIQCQSEVDFDSCLKCLEYTDNLIPDSYQITNYYQDCAQCTLDCADSIIGNTNSIIYREYIADCMTACAWNSTVSADQQAAWLNKNETTIAVAQACMKQCPVCNADSQCYLAQAAYQTCIDSSQQCNSSLSGVNYDNDYMPYEYIVCQKACYPQNNTDKQFDEFFNCQQSCSRYGVQTTDVKRLNTSYEGAQSCIQSFCAIPYTQQQPYFNNEVTIFNNCVQSSAGPCAECQKNYQPGMNVPQICMQCYALCLQDLSSNHQDTIPEVSETFKHYFYDCNRQCMEQGNYIPPKQLQTIKAFQNCEEQSCNKIQCSNDLKCQQDEENYQNCQQSTAQCQSAQAELQGILNSNAKDVPYPTAAYVCQDACTFQNFSAVFKQKMQCDYQCKINGTFVPDPKNGTLQNFSISNVTWCLQHFSPICASWDTDCQNYVSNFSYCWNNEMIPECNTCQSILKQYENASYEGYPIACAQCAKTCINNTFEVDSPVIDDFFKPAWLGCTGSAKIQMSKAYKIQTTIAKYQNCMSNAPVNCKNAPANETDNCQKNLIAFRNCIQESQQCRAADIYYKNQQAININGPFPYQKLICYVSCIDFDQESQYVYIKKEELTCMQIDTNQQNAFAPDQYTPSDDSSSDVINPPTPNAKPTTVNSIKITLSILSVIFGMMVVML